MRADSVVKKSLTTAADGKNYRTKQYNLDLILAIGYRVRSPRGTQFRQWATTHLRDYLVKGFVMDDERLKDPGGWDYFDELLARIREIRASEKRFYQKVRDLFALSSDYGLDERATQLFFAEPRLDVALADRFGEKVHPREWFLVPLPVIADVVDRIKDGSINGYRYDSASASLRRVAKS